MWVADLAMNVPSHLNCLNKRLSTPFPQSNIAAAAAEGFTELYNGFIEENKANLRDLIAATGLVILLKFDPNHRFFCPLWPWNLMDDLGKQ